MSKISFTELKERAFLLPFQKPRLNKGAEEKVRARKSSAERDRDAQSGTERTNTYMFPLIMHVLTLLNRDLTEERPPTRITRSNCKQFGAEISLFTERRESL